MRPWRPGVAREKRESPGAGTGARESSLQNLKGAGPPSLPAIRGTPLTGKIGEAPRRQSHSVDPSKTVTHNDDAAIFVSTCSKAHQRAYDSGNTDAGCVLASVSHESPTIGMWSNSLCRCACLASDKPRIARPSMPPWRSSLPTPPSVMRNHSPGARGHKLAA
jgi:hypothetical protein